MSRSAVEFHQGGVQGGASSREARADGPDRHSQGDGCFLVAESGPDTEGDDVLLLARQPGDPLQDRTHLLGGFRAGGDVWRRVGARGAARRDRGGGSEAETTDVELTYHALARSCAPAPPNPSRCGSLCVPETDTGAPVALVLVRILATNTGCSSRSEKDPSAELSAEGLAPFGPAWPTGALAKVTAAVANQKAAATQLRSFLVLSIVAPSPGWLDCADPSRSQLRPPLALHIRARR